MSNSEYNRYNRYIDSILGACNEYDYTDKPRCISQHITYMLNRLQSMFKWSGLPESIPQRILEQYLQINGNVCFYKHNKILYVFTGGRGGEPDEYYRPTIYTIANPYLNLSKSLRIGKECVIMPNDSMYMGLIPLLTRYATAMTENELSINIASINLRVANLISAPDDRTYESAKKYLSDIREGKQGVIAESAFFDGVRTQPYGDSSSRGVLTSLIELEQYLKASQFNDLGLNANYNMKRESINRSESQMNNDSLLPLVDDMLECRRTFAKKVNEMYGTELEVDFASAWKDNIEEIELIHEQISGQPESSENAIENVSDEITSKEAEVDK